MHISYDSDINGQLTIQDGLCDDNAVINIPIAQLYPFYRAFMYAFDLLRKEFPELPHYNGGYDKEREKCS